MRDAVETTARAATAAGAKVDDIALPPIFEDAYRAHATIQEYEASRALAFEYDRFSAELSQGLRELLDAAAAVTPEAYDAARRITKRARQALADLMTDIDVLLTPSAPGAAPVGLGSTGSPTFNRLWTLMGTPCVNIPGLADERGLPLGVQIVGRFGRDRQALEAALFLEGAMARRPT
jgi:Asp-tRNA(Asn)/Glu-tRNA(Gln) amidotransferase A subunit family amidase